MKTGILLVAIAALIVLPGCPDDPASVCGGGQCANIFADGEVVCCDGAHPYYCDGGEEGESSPAEGCYSNWDDAYFGNPCTLPADRVCN